MGTEVVVFANDATITATMPVRKIIQKNGCVRQKQMNTGR